VLKTIACLLFAVPLAAQPPAADLQSVTAKLEQAAMNGNAGDLKAARAACVAMLNASPTASNAALIRYTIAYADWRLAFSPALSEKEQNEMIEDAKAQLVKAKHDDPWFAEELALLSAVYGGQIARNPDLGQTLGPDAAETLANAVGAAPSNPRVLMMQGLTSIHAPAEYGGDPRRGEEQLHASLKAFDAAGANAPWPNWGRFDTLVFLGQALAARGDTEGARNAYKATLEISPNNARVKALLAALK
jgi:tetratricopeptide (TPR) repeat protein